MSVKAVVAIIAFIVAMSGAVLGNMFVIMMIAEINRKRQDGNLVSYFGYTLAKLLRVFSEYRSLYPDEKLNNYALTAILVLITGMIILAALILLEVNWAASP
jgi:hypothetical protein